MNNNHNYKNHPRSSPWNFYIWNLKQKSTSEALKGPNRQLRVQNSCIPYFKMNFLQYSERHDALPFPLILKIQCIMYLGFEQDINAFLNQRIWVVNKHRVLVKKLRLLGEQVSTVIWEVTFHCRLYTYNKWRTAFILCLWTMRVSLTI